MKKDVHVVPWSADSWAIKKSKNYRALSKSRTHKAAVHGHDSKLREKDDYSDSGQHKEK